jgi:uncharacterized protein (TIGR02996 family)
MHAVSTINAMSSDHDAMFRAVCADHEDDTPRLAFADWFDENDQPERAAFIRAQVEFARLMSDSSDSQAVYEFLVPRDYVTWPAAKWELIDAGIARRHMLVAQLEELWGKLGPPWLDELPHDCGVNWVGFQRGFTGRVEITDLDLLVKSADRVRAAAPPVELVCYGLTAADAERLIEAGLLPWIRGLEIRGDGADGLRTLGKNPAAAGIRTLAIYGSDGDGGGLVAEALAGSAYWAGLRSLQLRQMWVQPRPAEVLFRAAHLRSLTTLWVEGQGWSVETVQTFAETAFPNLTDLRLTRANLGDDAAEVLANAPSLGTVRYFDVGHNWITGRGATALLCSPHLKGMAFIGLESNPVRGLDRAALKNSPVGGLRLFHAHGCQLTVKDVAALARSPRLRDLWYLDLDANRLATGAVREIVRGFKNLCPPIIWLTMNRIQDAGAVALANWPAASALRVLELYQNPLTDFGVKTLLNSPHLKNLDGLGVPQVGEEVANIVRQRFKDRARME